MIKIGLSKLLATSTIPSFEIIIKEVSNAETLLMQVTDPHMFDLADGPLQVPIFRPFFVCR
jgi:hypothetical protein